MNAELKKIDTFFSEYENKSSNQWRGGWQLERDFSLHFGKKSKPNAMKKEDNPDIRKYLSDFS